MNQEKKTIEQMQEYVRMSTKLDSLEDGISDALWRLRDSSSKTKQFRAIERKYWLRIISRTVMNNNKLILRIINHYK